MNVKRLGILVCIAGGMILSASAQVIFSDNFTTDYASGITTMTGAGWNNNDWSNTLDTTHNGSIVTATGTGSGTWQVAGAYHALSGINYNGVNSAYQVKFDFATNQTTFNTGNRFGVGLQTGNLGIFGLVTAGTAGTAGGIQIIQGNPAGTNTAISSLVNFSGASTIAAGTFLSGQLIIGETFTTFSIFNGQTLLASVTSNSYTALQGTNLYSGLMVNQRNGVGYSDYFASFEVSAVPEPSSAALLGCGGLLLGWGCWRRRVLS